MLNAHPGGDAATAAWLDMLNPTEAERAQVKQATGLPIPSRADIEEIESSSRLSFQDGVLTLNTPMAYRDADGLPSITPLGFVLSERRLVTIRYAALPVFDAVGSQSAQWAPTLCSSEVFLRLMEAIVDRLADVLERIGQDLDGLSRSIFRDPVADGGRGRKPPRRDAAMQDILRSVGRAGDAIGTVRSVLLGVGRIVPYVGEIGQGFIPATLQPRLRVLERDIASLSDYDAQLNAKVNFLLDATLGLINIEQNNGIKVLTIVSIMGIPPTLVASIYGMNFKGMPELDWPWGYEYALTLIAVTAVAPLIWFKLKGWL